MQYVEMLTLSLNFFLTFSTRRSVDLSTTTDSKQFQELLIEHSKTFAQTEKASNDNGKLFFLLLLLNVLVASYLISIAFSLNKHFDLKTLKCDYFFRTHK